MPVRLGWSTDGYSSWGNRSNRSENGRATLFTPNDRSERTRRGGLDGRLVNAVLAFSNRGCAELKQSLHDTAVTAAGVGELKQAIPNCNIHR